MNKSRKLLNKIRNRVYIEPEGLTFRMTVQELINWAIEVDNLGLKKDKRRPPRL